ncbi:MAG: hypothetical protein QOC92_2688 [Acidimicrobiaceae bacterium]
MSAPAGWSKQARRRLRHSVAMWNEPVRGTLPEPGFFSLSGLEQMRSYLQNRAPSTPHARLLGYRLTQASSGSAVIVQPITPWFETYDGFIDLTATAELSVWVTAATAAPPATVLRSVTLSLRYLRPCTLDDESVIARGRVLHAGSNFTTVETLLEDSLGRAVAHATGCVLALPMDPPPPPLPYALDEPVDEAIYPTPDPSRRSVPTSLDATVLPPGGTFLGMQVLEFSKTHAITSLPTTEWFCLTRREMESGILAAHGTLTASILLGQMLEPSKRAVTFEHSSAFLAPVAVDGRPLISTATLYTRNGDVFLIDTEIVDADGQRVLAGRGALLASERRPRRRSRPSNRVLLTVLFTDVVGSTERATEVGDTRWRELLDEHHAVVRRQIETHMGREIKTTGDGFLATFDSPSRAVDCARAIRKAVARIGLEIRAGIHTGECELAAGDVSGLAVHVAARVQSAAEPGQVLVSSTVRDLVAGSDVELVDRGSRELKGLDGEWTLMSVEG